MIMLPITVIIPTNKEKVGPEFMETITSIKLNAPKEIFVINDDKIKGNANTKRNYGAKLATQPYLFFCDDDVWMVPGALLRLLEASYRNYGAGYVYGNFMALNHPTNASFIHQAHAFDRDKLKGDNYISTMSLIKTSAYTAVKGFDETLLRFQDWDLWLSMLSKGIEGTYLPEIIFVTDYKGGGITTKEGVKEARAILGKKHGIKL